MDIADMADSRIENAIADGIAEARRAPSLVACGVCHYCGETVNAGKLFCDASENECAKDYDNEKRLKRIAGK